AGDCTRPAGPARPDAGPGSVTRPRPATSGGGARPVAAPRPGRGRTARRGPRRLVFSTVHRASSAIALVFLALAVGLVVGGGLLALAFLVAGALTHSGGG
ncbi:MAG: hypothetical protein ACRD0J_16035, partial [Acidimicrobiales bacterium]